MKPITIEYKATWACGHEAKFKATAWSEDQAQYLRSLPKSEICPACLKKAEERWKEEEAQRAREIRKARVADIANGGDGIGWGDWE